jgi:hypothetical protein
VVSWRVVDEWLDESLRRRVSVAVELPTDSTKRLTFRVSTDQLFLVVISSMHETAMTPEKAFVAFQLSNVKDAQERDQLKMRLHCHPKTIARRKTIAKMLGRDCNRTTYEEAARIPLPTKVNHCVVNETDDPLYNGTKVIPYSDGTKWVHVELMGESKDGYSPMKSQVIRDPLSDLEEEDEDSSYQQSSRGDVTLLYDGMSVSTIGTSTWANNSPKERSNASFVSTRSNNSSRTESKKMREQRRSVLLVAT